MGRPLLHVCVCAALASGCSKNEPGQTQPPAEDGTTTTQRRATNPDCPAGGPSVDLNIRERVAGKDMSQEELGAVLGWIGGFVQPCIDQPSQAPRIRLSLSIPGGGEPPTFELDDEQSLPGMAACLDEGFAQAPPPPDDPMEVSITVPWGCPTLGADFQP